MLLTVFMAPQANAGYGVEVGRGRGGGEGGFSVLYIVLITKETSWLQFSVI